MKPSASPSLESPFLSEFKRASAARSSAAALSRAIEPVVVAAASRVIAPIAARQAELEARINRLSPDHTEPAPSVREIDCERAERAVERSLYTQARVHVPKNLNTLTDLPSGDRESALDAANARISHAIDRLQGARNTLFSRIERLTGSIPTAAGTNAKDEPERPSGQVRQLHYQLSTLELELTSLDMVIDRFSTL